MTGAEQAAYYNGLVAQHGPTYRAADWGSQQSQWARFRAIADAIGYQERPSVLDVGCGIGDLAAWLARCRYTGWDIADQMIATARSLRADLTFDVVDILDAPPAAYDWVVASGLFTYHDAAWFWEALTQMWARCTVGMAFTVLTIWGERRDEFQIDPPRVLNGLLPFSGKLQVRTDYLGPYDALFVVRR